MFELQKPKFTSFDESLTVLRCYQKPVLKQFGMISSLTLGLTAPDSPGLGFPQGYPPSWPPEDFGQ